jgi:hypothetical protein
LKKSDVCQYGTAPSWFACAIDGGHWHRGERRVALGGGHPSNARWTDGRARYGLELSAGRRRRRSQKVMDGS